MEDLDPNPWKNAVPNLIWINLDTNILKNEYPYLTMLKNTDPNSRSSTVFAKKAAFFWNHLTQQSYDPNLDPGATKIADPTGSATLL